MISFAKTSLLRLDPFEALAEISDFVAGLVQRVPKKPNEVKADLQNSTANFDGKAVSAQDDQTEKLPLDFY